MAKVKVRDQHIFKNYGHLQNEVVPAFVIIWEYNGGIWSNNFAIIKDQLYMLHIDEMSDGWKKANEEFYDSGFYYNSETKELTTSNKNFRNCQLITPDSRDGTATMEKFS